MMIIFSIFSVSSNLLRTCLYEETENVDCKYSLYMEHTVYKNNVIDN